MKSLNETLADLTTANPLEITISSIEVAGRALRSAIEMNNYPAFMASLQALEVATNALRIAMDEMTREQLN